MRLINLRTAVKTLLAISVAGLSSIASATTTTTTEEKGLVANLISVTGLNTANIIGGAVGGFAAGGVGLAGNIKRFALPGQGKTGAAGAAGGNLWNAWGAYSRSNIGYDFAPLHSSGNVDVYILGVDYTFSNNAIFGVAVAWDKTDVDTHFNNGKLEGDGYTISPYFGIALSPQLTFDATIGFGRTDIDTSGGGVNGSTDTDRTMGALGLTFRHNTGNWQLGGRAAYLQVQDKLGAYTLTNGTLVPDGTVNVSQIRLTGQIGYDAGMIVPFVGLSYINDLRRPDQAPVAGQSAANDDDAWTPTIGLRFKGNGSVYGLIQYSTERNRSEVKNDQFLLNLGVRF